MNHTSESTPTADSSIIKARSFDSFSSAQKVLVYLFLSTVIIGGFYIYERFSPQIKTTVQEKLDQGLTFNNNEGASNTNIAMSMVSSPICSESFTTDGNAICMIGATFENSGSIVKEVSGSLYAMVDDKIYEAIDFAGNLTNVYDSLNPGEKKTALFAFDVPIGGMFSGVFVGGSDLSLETTPRVVMPFDFTVTVNN